MSAAIKRVGKSKSAQTLNDLLLEASKTGDTTYVERHLDRTTTKFMSNPNDHFYVAAATRLQRTWLKGKGLDQRNPRVACRYMWLILDDSQGRGLVNPVDLELMRAAERDMSPEGPEARTATLDGFGARTGSAPPSSVGSSVSTATSAKFEELTSTLTSQLADIASSQAALTKQVAKTDSRVSDLYSSMNKIRGSGLGNDSAAAERGKCFVCKKKGHSAANCPVVKKAQGAEEEDEE